MIATREWFNLMLGAFLLTLLMLPSMTNAQNADLADEGRNSWIGSLPDLYQLRLVENGLFSATLNPFRAAPYIDAAIKLQNMGEKQAIQELLATRGYHSEKTFVLCRMLITRRNRRSFRSPKLLPTRPIGFTEHEVKAALPLYPIAICDGVPFCVTVGPVELLGDYGERGDDYVRYCINECNWRKARYRIKTREERSAALAKLMRTSKWTQAIGEDDWKFLRRQVN